MKSVVQDLVNRHVLISDQIDKKELIIILSELEKQLINDSCSSIVEFGCYTGTTSLFIRRLLDRYCHTGEYHVYDSFAGLPEKSSRDYSATGEQFVAGELRASRKQFVNNFKKANLKLPIIHKSWFDDLSHNDVPQNIMFAFLDGDYYASIKDSFDLITPKLAINATIVVDDYSNIALPGASRATDEWTKLNRQTVKSEASLGIIYYKKFVI